MRNPSRILGKNLAIHLQADLGTGPGQSVPKWANLALHGDAVQGANISPPTLVPNSFGKKPGVSCQLTSQGLVLALDQPVAIGQRPRIWALARLNKLVHDVGSFQALALLGSPTAFTNYLALVAYATGTFDSNAYWDLNAQSGSNLDTSFELPELDLAPHVLSGALVQSSALRVDDVETDLSADPGAFTAPCDTLYLSNNQPAGGPITTAGFWNIGLVIMTFDTPTPEQDEEITAFCRHWCK